MKKLNLNISTVMSILLRALDYIDVRLVDHGHRVAYIVYKMMQMDGSYKEKDMRNICIIASLHDIGAYKTEEINHMMRFESEDVFDHSIYGYLFLKYMSPLREWADIVLYHHLDYEKYNKLICDNLDIVDMIHLADRMDTVLQMKSRWPKYDDLHKYKDVRFGGQTIDLFQKANERFDIEGNIMNGSYLSELSVFGTKAEYNDEMLLEFIKMIAYSIDFRSETTVSHVIATVSISLELGKLFHLDEREMKKIQLGAYLHDIGKISTPLEILEKPGSLTNEEMLTMKEHIDITGKILKDRIHDHVLQIAYRHHEKCDGSGYPEKLMEEQLTLNDKIVAIADTMSALTGKRSYKDSFPKEVVIEILQNQKDAGQLDGNVIDTAVHNYDKIVECSKQQTRIITNMYNDISREFSIIKERFEAL